MTDRPNLSSTSTEVLEHEATTLAGRIASATCRFLLVIAELDRREAWGASWGCASMAHWLSWRCSLSTSAAREHVRVARALEQLPATVAAFERGELSYSKVRAITRVATPEGEHELVELARTATAAQLETIIRATAVALADPAQRDAVCGLFTSADADGLGVVRARVPIDELGILETAVDKALATVPKDLGEGADSPLARRRAAALVRICESYLVHGDGSRHPAHRNNAVVHVEGDPDGVAAAQTEAGVPVHPESARRLLCDAQVEGMLGELNIPIGSGRRDRTINRRQRRALHRRSGGACEWPGCDERRYVQGHHLWHWTNGGPTELWNLANLCWHHHHRVHEGGWDLHHDGRGNLRPVRPDGTVVDLTPPATADHLPLVADTPVEREAIVPLWAGEAFDLAACVDAVLTTVRSRGAG